ncbi:MAG: DUF2203 family protein [Planctomycetota bacterium]|nr:MAG: DUF2203 family protein [Planctomycetota bacterium]
MTGPIDASASSRFPKYFTPEEANRMLPLLRAIVRDIVTLFRQIHDQKDRLNELAARHRRRPREADDDVYAAEVREMEREMEQDIEKLEACIDELRQLGVQLKDPVLGLIDFPAKCGDRDVFLCWQLGEDTVAYWHDLDAGFAGRRPISELPQHSDTVAR